MEFEIDGRKVQAKRGASVLDAALDVGIAIPHFCYHKKLSVTAGCRMCMVDVHTMPRPIPACATPVTEGMVVHTDTERVREARRSVMEFLLINHPLDCPVCDQGGECRLQDYSEAYGIDRTRYQEEKRVSFVKDIGPLISMQSMSRCIQCTRCVRFCQEIAGVTELTMIGRGESIAVAPLPDKWVDSELSGNLVDVCPVGALTSKPFLFSARVWELASNKAVSPHDSLGSNLVVQSRQGQVLRVLPFENEAVNECWLSDRDRFSYEALNSSERLCCPMVKQGGQWLETDWQTALSYVAHGLKNIAAEHGNSALAGLASPQATVEELYLLQKLLRALGSEKIEYRLRHQDARLDATRIVPWLGMAVSDVAQLNSVFFVGCSLRQEAPLLALRFRQAVKAGAEVNRIHLCDEDWLMPIANQMVSVPVDWPQLLASVVKATALELGIPVPEMAYKAKVLPEATAIAQSLIQGTQKAILLGTMALGHREAAVLLSLCTWLASHTRATLGCLPAGANGVGGMVAKALPAPGSGQTLQTIQSASSKAFLLLHTEPELESFCQPAMAQALKQADMVVMMSPFRQGLDYADVLLPVSPFTETSGTFINLEGRIQSFTASVDPLGSTRPAWKVLRVLGNFLGLAGFDFDSSEAVLHECLDGVDLNKMLKNTLDDVLEVAPEGGAGMYRIGDMPMLFADQIVRRAVALQKTVWAKAPEVQLPVALFTSLGLQDGEKVRVTQAYGEQVLPAKRDVTLPENAIRIVSGHRDTAMLGPVDGWVEVARV